MEKTSYERRIMVAMRRIIRAVNIQSRKLAASHSITGPQLICLATLAEREFMTTKGLGEEVQLSSSTVIGILDRLEQKGLIHRVRDVKDRRIVKVSCSESGKKLLRQTPTPTQDKLSKALKVLPDLEQATIALSVERIVEMIEAEDMPVAPSLDTAPGPWEDPKEKI